jgi:DNA-binding HxlR family transcriptional regulator
MPDFLKDSRRYYTPVEYVFDHIGGLYKMPILWRLKDRSWRFSELKRSIDRASDRMMSKALKELISSGFATKETIPEVPVKTIYSITEKGQRAIPIITTLRDYGFELMKEDGIKEHTK